MIRINKHIILLTAFMLMGCKSTNWKSSVPDFAIHLEINTRTGMFVNFVPDNITSYMIVDKAGFHLNGITQPLTVMDAYGFAGTVIYIDGMHPYGAYDLCCPHCLKQDQPCYIDGMFAVCPTCGERYDIYSGNGIPQQGISNEPLKEYQTTYNATTGILYVNRKR